MVIVITGIFIKFQTLLWKGELYSLSSGKILLKISYVQYHARA